MEADTTSTDRQVSTENNDDGPGSSTSRLRGARKQLEIVKEQLDPGIEIQKLSQASCLIEDVEVGLDPDRQLLVPDGGQTEAVGTSEDASNRSIRADVYLTGLMIIGAIGVLLMHRTGTLGDFSATVAIGGMLAAVLVVAALAISRER